MKFEILNVQEEDLAEKALEALRSIGSELSKGTPGQLQVYLQPIVKECNEHLEDAPTKQSQAAGRILETAATSSPRASNFLVSAVIPHIFTLHNSADSIAKRKGLFEVFVKLVQANARMFGDWRLSDPTTKAGVGNTSQNALSKFSHQAVQLLSAGLSAAPIKEVSFRLTLLDGLLQLVKVRELLDDEEISKIIQLFYEILVAEDAFGKDEIKAAAINGLVEIAHQKPQLIVDKAFPAFMAQIPDSDNGETRSHLPVLEGFAKLATEAKVFQTVVLRLRNKLNAAIYQGASSHYLVSLLSATLYAFSKGAFSTGQVPIEPYYEDVTRPILLHVANSETLASKSFEDDAVIDLIGRISNATIRPLPTSDHQTISNDLYSLYRSDAASTLPSFAEGTIQQQRLMLVSTHLMAALRKDVKLPFSNSDLLQALVKFSQFKTLTPRVRSSALKQISLLVNKFTSNAELKNLLEPILYAPMDLLSAAALDDINIRIIFAILKGLVLRNSPILSALFPSLLEALTSPAYGTLAARGFSTLLQPDDLLIKDNYCTISGLHKQKSFALLVPAISASFKAATPETKTNYLIALSGLLRWISFEIMAPELTSLPQLLLQSLDLKGEDDVKASTIEVLILILNKSPSSIEEHTSSLITRLINAANPKANPPIVRVEALKCLTLVPGAMRTEVIMPVRRQVIKKLTAALDDRKRVVRVEAVRCRAKWLDVDEAGDDDD